jgi:DNA-binding MarR family transcriptional regulator
MGTKQMGTHAIARSSSGAATALADPATRAVLDAIRAIVRALREASRQAEQAVGLSAAQLFVLHRLAGAPPLSLSELAARTVTHQSSVSVVVTKLARRGLVARTRAAADARRLEITLTPAGRAVLGRAPAAAQDRLIAALAVVGPAARRRLGSDLGRVVEAMGLPTLAPPMFFEAGGAGARRRRVRPA